MLRVRICAVGRLNARAPEAALIGDYLSRFGQTGRPLGLGPATVTEVEDRKAAGGAGAKAAEAALLSRHIPDGAAVVALDERGRLLGSPDLAAQLGRWRDDGSPTRRPPPAASPRSCTASASPTRPATPTCPGPA